MTRRMADVASCFFRRSDIQFRRLGMRVTRPGDNILYSSPGYGSLLFQPTSYISDNYSGGISIRLVPRTSINYDQFYTFYKGDTTAQLAPQNVAGGFGFGFGVPTFTLPNGNPASLGLVFNTAAGQPCASPILPSDGCGSDRDPVCNGFLELHALRPSAKHLPHRAVLLTEQLLAAVRFIGEGKLLGCGIIHA